MQLTFQPEDTGKLANCVKCNESIFLRHWEDVQNEQQTKGGSVFLTNSGEWVCVQNGIATIGLTDATQRQFDAIAFLELPCIGSFLTAGESSCAVVESVRTSSDIMAPVSGTVIEINQALVNNPGLVNTAPESDGWICKIKMSNPAELNALRA